MNNNAILVAGTFSRHFLGIIACFQTVLTHLHLMNEGNLVYLVECLTMTIIVSM